jgi:hypothetical protein
MYIQFFLFVYERNCFVIYLVCEDMWKLEFIRSTNITTVWFNES